MVNIVPWTELSNKPLLFPATKAKLPAGRRAVISISGTCYAQQAWDSTEGLFANFMWKRQKFSQPFMKPLPLLLSFGLQLTHPRFV
jgi:hypothetical protein